MCADTLLDHPVPLAGLLAGLEHCRSPNLASLPCVAPDFPADLMQQPVPQGRAVVPRPRRAAGP